MYQCSKKGLRHIFPEHTYTDGVRVEVNMLPSGKFPEKMYQKYFHTLSNPSRVWV